MATVKEACIRKLKEAQKCNGDPEIAGGMAEKALLDFLIHSGNADIVREYKKVKRWFA